MKISVKQNKKVSIRFQGKLNMSQEMVLSKSTAKKLGKILTGKKSATFNVK